MKKCKVEDLEKAITQYLETNNLSSLRDFVGNCKGLAPYGETELGDVINSGDFDIVAKLLNRMSNFSTVAEDELKETEDELGNKDHLKFLDDKIKNAEEYAKKQGLKGPKSKKAVTDLEKFKEEKESYAQGDEKEYLEKKKDIQEKEVAKEKEKSNNSEQLNASENRGNKMEISKKDLTKIMSAMKTINKHFAEEAEDQVAEDQVEETTDEDETTETEEQPIQVVELPEDVANALREALDETSENDDVEEDEDEETSDDEDIEEESEEVDMCGDSNFSNMEEFYEFSEAITDTIANLNKKADKLAKESIDAAGDFIENFSASEFRAFADSVTATLENIAARVDMLDSKVTKNEVTTDIDNLKKTGDDMEDKFITKSDELKVEPIVENPEASVAESAQFSENHYKTVKDFLSL